MSGIQAYRRRAADTERMVDAAVAEVKADRVADYAAAKAKREARLAELAALPAVDPARLVPGRIIRNRKDAIGVVIKRNRVNVEVNVHGFLLKWPAASIVAVYELPEAT